MGAHHLTLSTPHGHDIRETLHHRFAAGRPGEQHGFYSMDVERDLFGCVVVVRRWGRIGTAGRTRMDEHPNEGRALAALAAIERQKRGRGYRA
jgi:predicted DNA-binding WGR domain protein